MKGERNIILKVRDLILICFCKRKFILDVSLMTICNSNNNNKNNGCAMKVEKGNEWKILNVLLSLTSKILVLVYGMHISDWSVFHTARAKYAVPINFPLYTSIFKMCSKKKKVLSKNNSQTYYLWFVLPLPWKPMLLWNTMTVRNYGGIIYVLRDIDIKNCL